MDVEHYNLIVNMSISKNNKYLLTTSGDFTAKLVDISSKIVINTFTGYSKWIHCAIFGNDNNVFITSDDYKIKKWNILYDDNGSKKCIKTYSGHYGEVTCLIYEQVNNRLFSSSYDTKIICWDVETGEKIGVMSGHTDHVRSLCFVNHNTVASASADATIKLWNTTTFECLKTLKSHTNWVNSVVTAPDGLHIISGADDYTIKIWNTFSGTCIETLKYHNHYIFKLAVSSNGKYIISGDFNGNLVITQVSLPFAFVVYNLNNTTLLSDGILRDATSGETIHQISNNDIITIVNDYSLQIGNKTFTKEEWEAQTWVEYIKAVQLQLLLPFDQRDSKCNIINIYRFDLFQTITHYKTVDHISKYIIYIIGNYTLY